MKPRLVLTGISWPEGHRIRRLVGKLLVCGNPTSDEYFMKVGNRIYSYSVQYQTPERKELS